MFLPKALLLSLLTLTLTAATPISTCSASACCPDSLKIKACQQEITTIRSHSLSDAAAIDLAPSATRTFFLTYVKIKTPKSYSLFLSSNHIWTDTLNSTDTHPASPNPPTQPSKSPPESTPSPPAPSSQSSLRSLEPMSLQARRVIRLMAMIL